VGLHREHVHRRRALSGDHWPHPQWQPLWYAGTRFDYIYPPALRYGTAAISKVTGFWPVKAYHFYVAFFYAMGIAGVYLLMRVGSKSRGCAYLGAVATSLMSPIFLFMPRFREDAWMLHPQRLGVLVKYGEGPHMSALALIPIALAFTWLALEKPGPGPWRLAAMFSAGVAANNFYGATALATFYPILVWSLLDHPAGQAHRASRHRHSHPRLRADRLLAGALLLQGHGGKHEIRFRARHHLVHLGRGGGGRGLRRHHRQVRARQTGAHLGSVSGRLRGLLLAQRAGQLLFQFPRHRRARPPPARARHDLHHGVYFLQWMWNRPGIAWRGVAIVLVGAAFWTTTTTCCTPGTCFRSWPDHTNRVEYRVTDWLWKNMPDARAYPTGSVRFWYDTWHDLAQVGGGSEQGLLNGQVEPRPVGDQPRPRSRSPPSCGCSAWAWTPSMSPTSSRRRCSRISSFRTSSTACCPCSSTTSRATSLQSAAPLAGPHRAWSRPGS
jgi:hypothetical protein